MAIPGDVTVDESSPPPPIPVVDTSGAAFVGPAAMGPIAMPTLVTNLKEFEQTFGAGADLPSGTNHLWYAARAFFGQGGQRLHVVRVATADDPAAYAEALAALEPLDGIGTVAAPGATADHATDATLGDAVDGLLIDHAERTRCRIALLDAGEAGDVASVQARRARRDSSMAALYVPWVRVARFDGEGDVAVPPAGFVAGVYARVDANRGVWKAPANEQLQGVLGLATTVGAAESDALNAAGVNTLRTFPGRGTVAWGARTMSADGEWRYVNVRRFLLMIEESLAKGLQWAVFEPNDQPLWQQVTDRVTDFLLTLWQQGALQGTKPNEAFFVRCDRTTMTQNDLDNGRLVVLVGVAPLKPAEFVIVRIGMPTATS